MKRFSVHQLACLKAMDIAVYLPRDSRATPVRWSPGAAGAAAPSQPGDAPATGVGVTATVEAAATVEAGTDEAAIASMDWDALAAAVEGCTRCDLHRARTQGVFGVGSHAARLLVVGEAPGAEEDRRGEPFVGRAGQLLERMLNAIGLDHGSVYITNILKSRPPDNRDPRPDEVAACEPYLRRQIELLAPEAILAVGRVAAQNLLKTDQALGRLRGRWHPYGPRETPVRVSYHPAYLLRRPAEKRKAWQDLRIIRDRLGPSGGERGSGE